LLSYISNVPWMPGDDWPLGPPPGVGVHLSLLLPVLCGVPPLWVLQAATLNPARALGLTDSLGTVAVGKVADVVLLEGDPLEDIWNVSKIAAVIANGRYFDRAALDRLERAAAAEWHTVAEFRQIRERAAAKQP
jgi:adenine deaminase